MSNETKVGLLAVLVIAAFIWGYKFLKGQNILTSSRLFYVEYAEVNQLAVSAPVFINGFQVGVISDIYLKPEDMQTIVTVLNIDRGIRIPKNTIAKIVSGGLMSGSVITLDFARPCTGTDCAESGDYLQGQIVGTLEALLGGEEIDIYMNKLGEGVGQAFDVLNAKIADTSPDNEVGATLRDIRATMANLQATTERLNRVMTASYANINGIFANLNTVTDTLAASNQQIKDILGNTAQFTSQLKDARMDQTIAEANQALEKAQEAISSLQKTLETTDKAMNGVNSIVGKINQGEGTIGKLMTDDELYYKLSGASEQVDSFLEDFEQRPYRYIPLKSRRKVLKNDKKDKAAGVVE